MNSLAFSHAISLPLRLPRALSPALLSPLLPSMNLINNRRRVLAPSRTLVPGRPGDYPSFKTTVRGDTSTPTPTSPTSPARTPDGRVILKAMTLPELEAWVASLDHKPFRARQLWAWLYKPSRYAATFAEMSDLALSFRAQLEELATIDSLAIEKVHEASDGTRKILFRRLAPAGGLVESVLIPSEDRNSLCFSSQVGCAYNCQFCFTGSRGLTGNLSMAEILDQVVLTKRFFENESGRIGNLIAMGEGEPFANYDNLTRALEVMLHKDGLNMSHNKVTVSTVGLVPEIRKFCRETKCNLAVSLHSANDKVRSWIMPVNRKYPLAELMGVLRDEFPRDAARQQKVFFEYVMLKGVNDSLQDAKELLRLVAGVPCKLNLIQFNAHDGTSFTGSSKETMLGFQDYLVKKGMTVTIRASRGEDKMMACGQLGEDGPVKAPRMRVPEEYQHTVQGGGGPSEAKRGVSNRKGSPAKQSVAS